MANFGNYLGDISYSYLETGDTFQNLESPGLSGSVDSSATDIENRFHVSVRESEKAPLFPVSTKGMTVEHERGN